MYSYERNLPIRFFIGPWVQELETALVALTTRDQLHALLELAGECGIEVRREPLGGEGGGLCRLRGQPVLFVDTSADLATQLDRCTAALATLAVIESHYIRPELRELLEKQRDTLG